jgi:hypothetical protein
MAQVGSLATKKLHAILAADNGAPASVSDIATLENTALAPLTAGHVIAQNVAPEVSEKSAGAKYPALHVYCGKVINLQREKFRTFSGEAHMVAEVRVSQDRLDGLEHQTQLYMDAVTRVLDQKRGDWGDGAFYAGGYEVNYGPVKHGGRNFIQIAKVSFVVDVSLS